MIKRILSWIIVNVFAYLGISFIEWELHPSTWPSEVRALFCTISALAAILLCMERILKRIRNYEDD